MFSYSNIGGKIKSWAQWIFALEAVSAAITGIALMASDDDLILAGLLVLLLGPFVAWVSSWLLYGYGQLIENSDIIREYLLTPNPQQNTPPDPKPSTHTAPSSSTPKTEPKKPSPKFECAHCHSTIPYYPCSECGFPPKDTPYWCGNCGQLGPYEGLCPQCGSSMKAFNTAD